MLISLRPAFLSLRRTKPDITKTAVERWEVGPAGVRFIRPAIFLDSQLDRVQATEFFDRDTTFAHLRGGVGEPHPPTYGYRLRDVELIDGAIYSRRGVRYFRPRSRRLPLYPAPPHEPNAAFYESWFGNRWFANWLTDDCPRYLLAAQVGHPITTTLHPEGHVPEYEARLGMTPARVRHGRFDEVFLFDDFNLSRERQLRQERLRVTLAGSVPHRDHPGTFIIRGDSGATRILSNEMEVAERLERDRGFTILDARGRSVEEIIAACAGAQVIAGVEGSHLGHGLAVMRPGAILLVIQPPTRMTSVLKLFTDRQDNYYAFVVGQGELSAFSADPDELIRTLDLALAVTG